MVYTPSAQQPNTQSASTRAASTRSSDFATPPGGYPTANPSDLRLSPCARADATASPEAGRELGAYAESAYEESVLQAKRRTPAPKRGKTHRVGKGAYGNMREPAASDAERFEDFDSDA